MELTGDYLADASIDTQSIPLQPLLALYAPDNAADVTGQTELHATLHGPLKKKEQVEAHVTIPVLQCGLPEDRAAGRRRAHPRRLQEWSRGCAALGAPRHRHRSAISGQHSDHRQWTHVSAAARLDQSAIAQLFDPDIRTSGEVRFNIDSHGTTSDTDIGGEINIVDANFASNDLPVGVQHGNGVLKVTKNRINIASFQATIGGGTLTAQGGIAYRPALQFDMGLAAKGARLLYPQGMRESVDANVRLAGTPGFFAAERNRQSFRCFVHAGLRSG